MIWFGSSSGEALTNKSSEARNVVLWVKNGWHVAAAYVIGFFVVYVFLGGEPADNNEIKTINCPVTGCPLTIKPISVSEQGTIGYSDALK